MPGALGMAQLMPQDTMPAWYHWSVVLGIRHMNGPPLSPCQTHNMTTSGSVKMRHGFDGIRTVLAVPLSNTQYDNVRIRPDTSWIRRYRYVMDKNASRCLPVRHTIRQRQCPCIDVMDMMVQEWHSLSPCQTYDQTMSGSVYTLHGYDGTKTVLTAPCQTYNQSTSVSVQIRHGHNGTDASGTRRYKNDSRCSLSNIRYRIQNTLFIQLSVY